MSSSSSHRWGLAIAAALALTWTTASSAGAAPILEAPFDDDYALLDLGSIDGLPTPYGGLTLLAGSADTLLIGGAANTASGALYTVGITRDGDGHITGFSGPATLFAEAAYNDGGVTYGPGGVLFLARWPVNELGQITPGSAVTDKIVDLAAIGVGGGGPGGLTFIPAGFAGAGALKILTWADGEFYDLTFAPDGGGTFDITGAALETTLPGGPEGFVYILAGNPEFGIDSMLVSEYSAGVVSAYDLDASGVPIVGTRREFITGLTGAEGAFVDPISGDFLFSTFGVTGGDHVIAVRGFDPVAPIPEPGGFALYLLGLVGIGLVLRRRERRAAAAAAKKRA